MKPLWTLTPTELAELRIAHCAECAGTGVDDTGGMCACVDAFSLAVHRAHFPPRLEPLTLADLDWDALQPDNARTAIQDYADALSVYLDANFGILLSGPVGCGKTHLAIGLGKLACALGYAVVFVNVPEWFQQLRDAYSKDVPSGRLSRQPSERTLLQTLYNAELLILDDLGAERASDWVRERLLLVVAHRWNQRLPNIVTTNEALDTLAQTIGERTLSRLCGDALVITLTGEDYRQRDKRRRIEQVQRGQESGGRDQEADGGWQEAVGRWQEAGVGRPSSVILETEEAQ